MLLLNGQMIEATRFPDRTSQIWKLSPEHLAAESFQVDWHFQEEAEFIHLAQLKALLDTLHRDTRLTIHYLPYARQDKEVSNQSTFALRPFASLLNGLGFKEIILLDPHSSVATTLIRNSRAEHPIGPVTSVAQLIEAERLCYPDRGARDRYGSIYPIPSLHGEKVRDPSSGRIDSYSLIGDPRGLRVLIVDDICDGGATFSLLAQELLAHGAASVDLFVTHGLFSKGLAPLHQAGIGRVFTVRGEAFESSGQIRYKDLQS